MKRTDGAVVTLNSTNRKRVRARSRTIAPKNVSSAKYSDVVKLSATFPTIGLKHYDFTIHINQINHVLEKPKLTNAEAEEKLKKTKINFMIHWKGLMHKTSVDSKLPQLKICVRDKQKERALEEYSPVFSEITQSFGLLFAGDKIVIPQKLKKQVVDALRFGHPGSTKKLTESNIFKWSGMRKDIENKYDTSTTCMSAGKNLKYQLPSTEKIKLLVMTEPGKETQVDFSGRLHNTTCNRRTIGIVR